mmetsp:Transcript_15460/g.31727  ORF Transcript_15460/g.31727 Transcript_15460/m.31727 type:complete len:173 (-) Transcript_15460:324-842(-)
MQNLTKLEEFVLENNDVSGSIPTEIGYLTSLKLLNLRGNSFTGEIPSEIGQLTNLREILLENNYFRGKTQLDFSLLKELVILTIDDKDLVGSIPGDVRTLEKCVLCGGNNYEVMSLNRNFTDDRNIYEGKDFGEIGHFSCIRLLKENEQSRTIMSADACKAFEVSCVACSGK